MNARLAAGIAALIVCGTRVSARGQAPALTLPAPQIFAPGVIAGPGGDGSPGFSPDGNTLLFTRSAARWSAILESHHAQGRWSEPALASFSGTWSDSSPAMSPDGTFVVFVSSRPEPPGSRSPASAPTARPPLASHLWRVDRTATGWGQPVELPATVNFCRFLFRPSVAQDGSVYFTASGQGKELRLFVAPFRNGAYQPAEPLTFSDGNLKDVDPEIAPDQSFLIFTRMAAGAAHEKLFLVRNTGQSDHRIWGSPEPLRYAGDEANGSSDDNDARLGSDGHTLYFSSDRTPAVVFPRTHDQAVQDVLRMNTWDNGNTNIWSLPFSRP